MTTLDTLARGVLAQLPVSTLTSSPRWSLQLVVRDAGGRTRETRFDLKLQ